MYIDEDVINIGSNLMDYISQLNDNIKRRYYSHTFSWVVFDIFIILLVTIISGILFIFWIALPVIINGFIFFLILLIVQLSHLVESEHTLYVNRKVKFYNIVCNMLTDKGFNNDKITILHSKIEEFKKQIRNFITLKEIFGTVVPVFIALIIQFDILINNIFADISHIAYIAGIADNSVPKYSDETIILYNVLAFIAVFFYIIFYVIETLCSSKVWVNIYNHEKDIVKILSDILQEQNIIDNEIYCNIEVKNQQISNLKIVVFSLLLFGYIWLYITYQTGKKYIAKMSDIEDTIIKSLEKL